MLRETAGHDVCADTKGKWFTKSTPNILSITFFATRSRTHCATERYRRGKIWKSPSFITWSDHAKRPIQNAHSLRYERKCYMNLQPVGMLVMSQFARGSPRMLLYVHAHGSRSFYVKAHPWHDRFPIRILAGLNPVWLLDAVKATMPPLEMQSIWRRGLLAEIGRPQFSQGAYTSNLKIVLHHDLGAKCYPLPCGLRSSYSTIPHRIATKSG